MLSERSPRLANASRSTPIAGPRFVVAIGVLRPPAASKNSSPLLPRAAAHPLGPRRFRDLAGGGAENHRRLFRLAATEFPSVQLEKNHHSRQRGTLVSIEEWMVS